MTTTRIVLLIAASAIVAGAPLGHRIGLLPLTAALGLLLAGLLPVLWILAAGLLALARGGLAQLDVRTAAALMLAAGVSAVPLSVLIRGLGGPPIHDITTDTDNPPRFDAVVAARADAPNPLEYAGAELAAAQRAAYPDVRGLDLEAGVAAVADLAAAAAEDLGWQVVAVTSFAAGESLRSIDAGAASPPEPCPAGARYSVVLLEATDTTFWFGFRDDVAVRMHEACGGSGGGTRVDVRSISRVGVGDLGANAARIRRFVDRLENAAREAAS